MISYDVDEIIEDLINEPKTIKSIVKDNYGNNSYTNRLKKHLNKAFKNNYIFKGPIIGYHRQKLYYAPNKEYIIINTKEDNGKNCLYCVYDFKPKKDFLEILKAKVLENNEWKEIDNITIKKNNILKFY